MDFLRYRGKVQRELKQNSSLLHLQQDALSIKRSVINALIAYAIPLVQVLAMLVVTLAAVLTLILILILTATLVATLLRLIIADFVITIEVDVEKGVATHAFVRLSDVLLVDVVDG